MTTAPQASGAESETTITRSSQTVRPARDTGCVLCGRIADPAWPDHPWCAGCIADLIEQIHRRQAAELRLQPLDDYWQVAS